MHTKTDDSEFEQQLDKQLAILQLCQKKKNLKSCSSCELFIGCDVRLEYIKSVYNSMSKGQSGGFEF